VSTLSLPKLDTTDGQPRHTGAIAPWRTVLALLPLIGALLAWALSLSHIDLYGLDDYGLVSDLPYGWFAALAVCAGGAAVAAATGARGWIAGVYVLGTAVVLYATLPLLADQPHYSWVYKHIGVVRYLESSGHTDTSIDIYNRWPGFFALGAVFSSLSGVHNPASYAAWTEFFFTLINLSLLSAIVRTLTRSAPVAAGAALLFLLSNWVGQTYFAPQAFGFTLDLAILWVVTTQLLSGRGRAAHWIAGVVKRIMRREQDLDLTPSARVWRPGVAVAIVLVLDAAIIASHQLTPYLLAVQLLFLALLGLLRPWWIVPVLVLMAFAFLLPNLDYVRHNFGLFSSFDPFNNAKRSSTYDVTPLPGKAFNARAGQLLAVTMWAGAALSLLALARRGAGVRALVLAVLAFCPFAMIFGQNYGGEASLRVILFSTPWCSALIAWALVGTNARALLPKRVRATRTVALTALALAWAALFLPAYFGQEELNSMPLSELQASDKLYAEGLAGSVVMLSGPNFPIRYGSRYRLFRGPQSDDDPNLLRTEYFRHRALGPRDVTDVIGVLKAYSNRGYVVFSTTQYTYAKIFKLTPPGEMRNLEHAIATSPRFKLWLKNKDTRIYELVS
jgi:hypothetical protein